MDVDYKTPECRTDASLLKYEIEIVNKHPVITGLLDSIGGIVAVLDENRQIVSLNDSFLKMLGIDNAEKVFGLRPGEALGCIHSSEGKDGCGTSKYCSSCGAAMAIVASFAENRPVEKLCALSAMRGGKTFDLVLLVRSHPIQVEKKRFLLLFLQDVTIFEHRAALERTFFHDINNILGALLGASELLVEESPSVLAESLYHSSLRLIKEVDIQRSLLKSQDILYRPLWENIQVNTILEDLQVFFLTHNSQKGKKLIFEKFDRFQYLKTDFSLVLRILSNMILNALEATVNKGVVRVWVSVNEKAVVFNVWNKGKIDDSVAMRIFQKNFSTKNQAGRGLGTYAMKFFGEGVLDGKVDFLTSFEKGTIFTFSLPVND